MILLLACTEAPQEPDGGVVSVPWTEGCENLDDLHCSLPYPSDRYLEADERTVTGWRLRYTPEMIPVNDGGIGGEGFDFAPYDQLDGMSASSRILTLFDRPADLPASGTATQDDIERSLEPEHPTVLLDLTTGERIAHWVENDARADAEAETALYLNPASRLDDDHAYAVALRGLLGGDGTRLDPRPAFAAVRDGHHTDAPDIEARWESLQAAFKSLERAAVPREDLQAMWTFHTASQDNLTRDLLHMRDDAMARVGPSGGACTVTDVEEGYSDDGTNPVYRRVRGTFTVPSYMEGSGPGHRLARGPDGLPAYQGDDQAPFTFLLPYSLAASGVPGRLLTYGHGLLGTGEGTVSSAMFRYVAERGQMAVVATDWWGMSREDEPTVAAALVDFSTFVLTTDRLHQGIINFLVLARSFAGGCASLPELTVAGASVVDPTQVYFAGGSQGGILGGTVLAIHPDIDRGVLLVNGANFPFMIERSIDFLELEPVFQDWYPRRIDRAVVLPLTQHLWDHTEPQAYLPHVTTGLSSPPKHVLSIAAKNDQQVPNLASDMAARMMGIPEIQGSARHAYGLEQAKAPYEGSGYVTLDLGDRAPPTENLPADFNDEGHSTICWSESCIQLMDNFLRPDGLVTMPCDGVCDPD